MTALVTVNRRPLTAGLLAALRAGLPTQGAADVAEVGRAPVGAGSLAYHVILYPIEGGAFTGPPVLPGADAHLCYQTTSVAKRGDQMEELADRVRRIMMEADPVMAGLTIMDRWLTSAGGMDAETTVLSVPERFYYAVTTS